MTDFSPLDGHKYISLETYRKTGAGVRTPVWFAADGQTLYVYTFALAGKAKRIRRDGTAKVAACDARGKVKGPWIEARAVLVGPAAFAHGMTLLNRKYWPWKQALDLYMRLNPKHQRVVIAITPAAAAAANAG